MSTLTFHLDNLPRTRVNAIKRRARELGVTLASYIRKLIEDDIDHDVLIRNSTFAELSAPLRDALADVSAEELDRRVDAARTKHHKRSTSRKR